MNAHFPSEVTNQLRVLGAAIHQLYKDKGYQNYKSFADACNLSINSVKSIFKGKTGNIANYLYALHVLGTNLSDFVSTLDWGEPNYSPTRDKVPSVFE